MDSIKDHKLFRYHKYFSLSNFIVLLRLPATITSVLLHASMHLRKENLTYEDNGRVGR